jgi:hypothetical protein
MRDGYDVCTTNVVEEAFFSFPQHLSKPRSGVKVFNNV